ncbi:hypothetical protein HDU76_002313, partial [Blyttiomyces sp. JEL0837]
IAVTIHDDTHPSPTSSTSLRDLLPPELQEQIFNNTDIPTRFINKYPVTDSEIEENAQGIWIAVINTNSCNQLDLTRLRNSEFPTILDGLDQVTSREVYHDLCKRKPHLAGIEYFQKAFEYKVVWNKLEMEDTSGTLDVSSQIHVYRIPKRLIHIPMRQYWTDELNGLNDLDQLKLFLVAGSCCHLKLFQHYSMRYLLRSKLHSGDSSNKRFFLMLFDSSKVNIDNNSPTDTQPDIQPESDTLSLATLDINNSKIPYYMLL